MIELILFCVFVGMLAAPVHILLVFGPKYGYLQVIADLLTDPLMYVPKKQGSYDHIRHG